MFIFLISSNEHSRKRPLIVFDGSSSHSGPVKLKKPVGTNASPALTDRLKPPPAANASKPIRRLSGSTSSSSSSSVQCSNNTGLKREASSTVGAKPSHLLWDHLGGGGTVQFRLGSLKNQS